MKMDGTLLTFDKAMLFSDKRVQDLPYKLPPLSRPLSEEPDDVEGDEDDDVAPSTPNISVREACLALPLLIQKVEFAVSALEDLKGVGVSLRRIQAALSPATI